MLTVTNVGISDNGADYFCAQGFNSTRSDTVFLTVFGELSTYVYVYVRAPQLTSHVQNISIYRDNSIAI